MLKPYLFVHVQFSEDLSRIQQMLVLKDPNGGQVSIYTARYFRV